MEGVVLRRSTAIFPFTREVSVLRKRTASIQRDTHVGFVGARNHSKTSEASADSGYLVLDRLRLFQVEAVLAGRPFFLAKASVGEAFLFSSKTSWLVAVLWQH